MMEMDGIEHRTVQVNGINMHIAEKGQGPLILFIHGFPKLWYSWRHQITALASLGYRAVAQDLCGFGDTDALHAPSSEREQKVELGSKDSKPFSRQAFGSICLNMVQVARTTASE
ncbi:hypothetical protein CerSpe_013400 [Prunus speciosa]